MAARQIVPQVVSPLAAPCDIQNAIPSNEIKSTGWVNVEGLIYVPQGQQAKPFQEMSVKPGPVPFRQMPPRQRVSSSATPKSKLVVISQDDIVEYQVLLTMALQADSRARRARERIEKAFASGLPVEGGLHTVEFVERIRRGKKCMEVEIL